MFIEKVRKISIVRVDNFGRLRLLLSRIFDRDTNFQRTINRKKNWIFLQKFFASR